MSIYNTELEDTYKNEQYNSYLEQHINNVYKGYEWVKENLPEIVDNKYAEDIQYNIEHHDASKYMNEEYDAYANYFYGEKTEEVKSAFDFAWLHHIHNNPHHWQHWVLINDEDGTKALDMPYPFIAEMFCDHWAFSWSKGNLKEVKNWYNSHKDGMMLSEKTRKVYETILDAVMTKLDELTKF